MRIVKALSIKQPWAWLIVNGFKNIENRPWKNRFRGRFLIHSPRKMDMRAYDHLKQFYNMPPLEKLERGGIVGGAEVVDCVTEHTSEWFDGKYGFVLENPVKFEFAKCPGQLGFFNVDVDAIYVDGNVGFENVSKLPPKVYIQYARPYKDENDEPPISEIWSDGTKPKRKLADGQTLYVYEDHNGQLLNRKIWDGVL